MYRHYSEVTGTVVALDDEPDILAVMQDAFSYTRIKFFGFSDSKAALDAIQRLSPNVLIIDKNLGNSNGLDFIESNNLYKIPSIIISAENDPNSKRRAYSNGLVDYVLKPFLCEDIVGKVYSILTRIHKKDSAKQYFGNIVLDMQTLTVEIHGVRETLTSTEFKILSFFVSHPNKIISKSELLKTLWPNTNVIHRTVDTHIGNLRRKLMRANHEFQNVFGKGYRFVPTHSSNTQLQDITSSVSDSGSERLFQKHHS